jgi:uncharacterized membrane protein YecN with MAPEG domain
VADVVDSRIRSVVEGRVDTLFIQCSFLWMGKISYSAVAAPVDTRISYGAVGAIADAIIYTVQ